MATAILSETKKHEISTVDALWTLIQGQTKSVQKALVRRLLEEEETTKAQKTLVKKSLTQAFNELYSGQIKHDARSLFHKSDS